MVTANREDNMTKPFIHDGITEREMTDAEYKQWQELVTDIENRRQSANQSSQLRQSALNKLQDLGLTDAEIVALVG